MDALNSLASNGIYSLIAVLLVIGSVLVFIKKGYFSFKGHGLSVGTADSEAKVRNMQQTYANAIFEGIISHFPEDYDYYKSRFIIAKCLDEVERMIRENHITSDDTYIETEYQIIKSIVVKHAHEEYFKNEFQTFLRGYVEKLIKQLEKIRLTYGK